MDGIPTPNSSDDKQDKVRIYVVQRCPRLLDLEHGVQTATEEIAKAADAGANLVAFPETWLTGYPAWVFGMAKWNDPEARSWYKRLVEASPTASSSYINQIRDAARENNIEVVLGFNERGRESGGTIYNSVAMIGRDGSLRGLHRKLTPTHAERLVWANGDAQGLVAYDTSCGRIGAAVCWEHFHPLIRHALHKEDEQIHIALWPDMPSAHQIASRQYAFEGRCFVVAAASYLDKDSVPPELLEAYVKGAGSMDLFTGGSSVIGPDGEYIAGPVYGPEPLIADIDIGDTIAYKHDLDVAGHYGRPDVFELLVNRESDRR
ncbi:hypothetical protein NW752_001162 [Fusarium irregulare]|uniref:CN hydrolase domain-containing protein n=1 Tax=Fusarium irregulare TaxID=2494466 RepID=A0A9W8U4S5_9HYPO|nr:hypothetical protein NW766_010743 [Fusarium irregulare]KAJ4026223.1 hypothetical protein NW752_001162 [Fusarium irregulare]